MDMLIRQALISSKPHPSHIPFVIVYIEKELSIGAEVEWQPLCLNPSASYLRTYVQRTQLAILKHEVLSISESHRDTDVNFISSSQPNEFAILLRLKITVNSTTSPRNGGSIREITSR